MSVCDLCHERSHRIYTFHGKNAAFISSFFFFMYFFFISQFKQLDNTY